MAGQVARTFLAESYVPHLEERTATVISGRLRAAAFQLEQEGLGLGSVRSFALLDEETYLCVVEASDCHHVLRLSDRAEFTFDHLVEMVAIDAPSP